SAFAGQPPAESILPPAELLPAPTRVEAPNPQPNNNNSVGRSPRSDIVVIMPYSMEAPEHGYTDTLFGRIGGWMTGGKVCDGTSGRGGDETCRPTVLANRPIAPIHRNCQPVAC